ncbi:MAG: hypothetical protein IKW14_04155 [Phascolarctobacterium sp.]|nr:hypothetical protein [Phascolarctobacterium sp.]
MIKVRRNAQNQYCVHCLANEKTFMVSIKNSTGMQFVVCQKCAEKLLVELTKALAYEEGE